MNTVESERERFYNVVKRGETTKLVLGKRHIFVGEFGKFLANFICTNAFTICLLIIMAVSLLVYRTNIRYIYRYTIGPTEYFSFTVCIQR